MKGELSENDLKYKAEAYCSSMERCVADVEAKLSQWGATPEMMEKIVRHLQDDKFCLTTVDTIFREEEFSTFIETFKQSDIWLVTII